MNVESRTEPLVTELHVNTTNKPPKEVLRARTQAETLIDNNELYINLGLTSREDKRIFELSVEERLIRNEIIAVSNKIPNLSNRGVLGFINRGIIKQYEGKIERLYKAKELITSEKEGFTKYFDPKEKIHSHNIELAANDIFREAQEIHSNPLIPETILDDWIIDRWAFAWKRKFKDEQS
jgi:hypothetical protein